MTKQITIAGAGALGSHLLQFIRNEDASFYLIDFDKVERKNTMSQFHGVKTVGKSKVQALQQTMKFMFGSKIDGSPHKLTKTNVETLLKNSYLVVDCLDNAEARQLVQDFVRKNDIPCVHGGLAADGQFGQVIWDERFNIDTEPSESAPTCEDGGEQLAFIGLVSAFMARAVHEFLVNDRKLGFQINPAGAIRV